MIAADLCEEAFGKKGPENEFRSIAEIALENWHFALELFLKYIILTENETYEETGISHDIDYLIDKVSDKTLIPESELYDDWDIIKTDGWRPSKRYLPARKISSIKKYCDSYRRICKWIQEKLNK